MYNNIGEKIKGLAESLFVVEAILTFVGGIVLLSIDDSFILTGLLMLICGSLIAWISSWLLYAFGQFVDDIHAIRIRVNMPEIKAKKHTTRLFQRRANNKCDELYSRRNRT